MAETGLFLEGLRCAGCVQRVERALRQAPGVEEANANYGSHRALVVYDPARSSPEALVRCVEQLGYTAVAYDPAALERGAPREARRALARLLVAFFLAANVMLLAAALYIGSYQDLDPETRRLLRWLALALSLPAATWCALPFWRGALGGLRRLEVTMDLPIVLGISIAFGVGVAGTLSEADHLYVDSAATIVFLILLGRTLESRSRARASGAIDRITALSPRRALRRSPEGVEEVPAESLREGDRVIVPAGERVAADGRILRGATEMDESLLSGESLPVLRRPGDEVACGTRNVLGEIEIEVTAPVGAGSLAHLAALLERAQARRPRIQRLADRVAAVFAPAVVAVALLTAAAWWWSGAGALDTALTAAAVLIVACPCALGLATPAAVTAAIGRAASLGILVKSGEALERCAAVDAALLDKTGTLTEGRFAVEEVAVAPGVAADEVLLCAAAAEGASTHPIAQALNRAAPVAPHAAVDAAPAVDLPAVDAAPAVDLPAVDAAPAVDLPADAKSALDLVATRRALPGRGIEAETASGWLRVGSRELLAEHGVAVAPDLAEAGEKLAARGASLAWVARGPRALGVVALSDPPRSDAREAVSRLQRLGIQVALVSGDHPAAVELAGVRAGIADRRAGLCPEAKLARVEVLRAAGRRILVAGDGINDAAALAGADLGVGMARGADLALHAADLVIRSPHLGALADAVELSRATLRRIRENLGFALAYNALAIPLAVAGLLQPLHAALAMSASSLLVTANAARLLRWRSRQ